MLLHFCFFSFSLTFDEDKIFSNMKKYSLAFFSGVDVSYGFGVFRWTEFILVVCPAVFVRGTRNSLVRTPHAKASHIAAALQRGVKNYTERLRNPDGST